MSGDKVNSFFTREEQARIREAAHLAEKGTSGEIATMIVAASDRYREGEVLGAVLTSGFVSLVLAVSIHHVTIWTYIPLVFVLYFPIHLLFGKVPKLKLPFVGRKRMNDAVRQSAVRAFYEKGLYRTADETGILIYISILERKVWILGDRGINARIPPDFWEKFAARLADGLGKGTACDSLCAVIADCGRELARHFPHRPDDVNELPDHLIM